MLNIAIILGDITRSAGTERAVTNLSNMLTEYGEYNVTIISLYSKVGNSCYYKLNENVQIEHLGLVYNTIVQRITTYFLFIKKTRQAIEEKNFDFVLGTTHAYNSLLIFLQKKVGKIACEHMNYAACPRISRIIRKFCYKKLDRVVLLTKADSTHYSFLNSAKVFVIPNTLSFTCETPSKLERKKIISVGRITEQKGFDLLVESAKIMKEHLLNWYIEIIGDGEDKQKVIDLINENSLQNFVRLKEPTLNIKEELLDSSIYVMSSRWEGLPMILLEAKACGLPIISFDCPEGPATVINDEEDGYIIPPLDVNELAKKVITLCENESLLKKMGKASYENSKKYLPENIFPLWNYCFKSL